MNQEEKTQINNVLIEFNSIDIKKSILEAFNVTEKDIDSKIILGSYTALRLILTIEKIITNLKREINSIDWSSLSMHANHHELGIRNLLSDISNVYNQVSNKTFDISLVSYLDWLVYYERTNNFWHVSPANISAEEITNANNLILSNNQIISKSFKDLETLKNEIAKLNKEVLDLINEKGTELKIISDNVDKTNVVIERINETSNDAKIKSERLTEIVKHSEEKSEEAKNRIEEERKKFDDYRSLLEALQRTLNEKIEGVLTSQGKWDEKLAFIEGKETFIKQKETEINDLTGFAAGVSLFHTFKERQTQLNKTVSNWFIGLIGAILLVIGGIYIIFNLAPIANNDWTGFALNSLKSLPLFVFLYFSIRQYTKERSIQEEYAFKSAVALTINAFADKISEVGNTGRDKMILESVIKVYEIPSIMKEKGGGLFSFRTRPLNDTLKNISDVLKEIKKP